MAVVRPSWPESAPPTLAPVAAAPPRPLWRSYLRLAVTLFKLRVVSLLLLSAFAGAALGAVSSGALSLAALLLLTVSGTLAAGGASAINQYLERDRDGYMRRTARRPLPAGQIAQPRRVLWLGLAMVLAATGLALPFNAPLAFWVLAGAVIYVGVYTIWLKPRTTLNIVIGGAAGSCAVISGGAAAGAWSAVAVWLLAALVFVWTPVHFWSLAIAYRQDYARADFPMLPARVALPVAVRWTAAHTMLTAAAGLALGIWPAFDPIFLLLVGLGTLPLFTRTVRLLRAPQGRTAMALFHYSNLYLALVLVIAMLASIWR